MSHCGLCGTYINDCYSDWYLCDDCGPYPDSHQRPIPAEMLPLWDRVRALFGLSPRSRFASNSEVDGGTTGTVCDECLKDTDEVVDP